MPFIENEGFKIFYEVFGEGYPLVVQHGLMGSLESWVEAGYIEALSERFKVIFIHARGHGRSDCPHEPEAYNVSKMASDIAAVMDDLGVERAHFFGDSMGGRIGLGMGMYHPERLTSLIVGRMGAVERDDPNRVKVKGAYVKILSQGSEAVVKALVERDGEISEKERITWMNYDLDCLIAYYSNVENIGFLEHLPNVDVPTLIFVGEQDSYYASAELCAGIMPHARFVVLPDLDHDDSFDRSDMVLPHVLGFLDEQDSG